MLRNIFIIMTVFLGAAQVAEEPESTPREIAFEWCPPGAPAAPYNLTDAKDQHRIVLHPKIKKGGAYPVEVAFHGQPRRGVLPRNYKFLERVKTTVGEMIDKEEISPVILVLPVFKFQGQNWPKFDVKAFRREIEARLNREGIFPSFFLAFGHSGAAGCGGDGLNQAHLMSPKAVGFFDTCLGSGWQEESQNLRKNKIETINIHSVETAGFKPKQSPEYQSSFDFGLAYGPVGMQPIDCPDIHPGEKLRDQAFRCAATKDRVLRAFVVDTGEGEEAHGAVVKVAVEYFLKKFVRK